MVILKKGTPVRIAQALLIDRLGEIVSSHTVYLVKLEGLPDPVLIPEMHLVEHIVLPPSPGFEKQHAALIESEARAKHAVAKDELSSGFLEQVYWSHPAAKERAALLTPLQFLEWVEQVDKRRLNEVTCKYCGTQHWGHDNGPIRGITEERQQYVNRCIVLNRTPK